MKNKIFPALMAGVLTLTVLTACGGGQAPQSEEKGSDLLAAIQAKGEIVVAMEGTWAPWTYHDETGELVGYDVEVANAETLLFSGDKAIVVADEDVLDDVRLAFRSL